MTYLCDMGLSEEKKRPADETVSRDSRKTAWSGGGGRKMPGQSRVLFAGSFGTVWNPSMRVLSSSGWR